MDLDLEESRDGILNWAWKEEGGQTDGTSGSSALGRGENAARGTLTVPALRDLTADGRVLRSQACGFSL